LTQTLKKVLTFYIKFTANKFSFNDIASNDFNEDSQMHFLWSISLLILSCRNKLDVTIIENNEIKIERYVISEITSMHEFADITNKRWDKTDRLCEANSGSIESIIIRDDSIIIKRSINSLFYDLAALKFGYKVVIEK